MFGVQRCGKYSQNVVIFVKLLLKITLVSLDGCLKCDLSFCFGCRSVCALQNAVEHAIGLAGLGISNAALTYWLLR